MRAVIQRVLKASVEVGGETLTRTKWRFSGGDREEDIEYLVRKLVGIRLFPCEENGRRWDKSVKDLGLEILCVSQFTLHATLKGNKPDFHRALSSPTEASNFYASFLAQLRKSHKEELVKDGRFGEMMTVNITNDGPVTLTIDSKNRDW
ncbi:hypothetical protein QR680_017677 [Steinernema hermaphroditum]|uniref:D-aminoacyl-tRNA deacylase n=1 Tax=Steinernema hermaphroditum TaxID=289476 RepID=A0AA39HHH0_9BILA|nr:hypothetical protein QR680_017677 [Steinernema hermaphroditum]